MAGTLSEGDLGDKHPANSTVNEGIHMDRPTKPFTALILAADRAPGDPVARAAGVSCKCLAPVGGTPLVLRVLDALTAAEQIGDLILCGPHQDAVDGEPRLRARIALGEVRWVENEATPSASTYKVLKSLPNHSPVLVTTADHGLLSPRIVDYFCCEARTTGSDLVVGLALHRQLAEAYPGTKRTVTRLRDGTYCSCNLFAFLTHRAQAAAHFWRTVERHRKKPIRVIRVSGWVAVLRYLLGRLSLDEGLKRISRRMNLNVAAVVMPFAEAAVDVDTVSDWRLVEKILDDQHP